MIPRASCWGPAAGRSPRVLERWNIASRARTVTCYRPNGAALVLATAEPCFRYSLYRHETYLMYIRRFLWNEATAMKYNGRLVTCCSRELIRAVFVMGDARCYWCVENARPSAVIERIHSLRARASAQADGTRSPLCAR